MTSPLPGQRAGQQPMRAALAAQRAVGRAANASSAVTSHLLINVRGQWWCQHIDDQGQEHLVPYDPQKGCDDRG